MKIHRHGAFVVRKKISRIRDSRTSRPELGFLIGVFSLSSSSKNLPPPTDRVTFRRSTNCPPSFCELVHSGQGARDVSSSYEMRGCRRHSRILHTCSSRRRDARRCPRTSESLSQRRRWVETECLDALDCSGSARPGAGCGSDRAISGISSPEYRRSPTRVWCQCARGSRRGG